SNERQFTVRMARSYRSADEFARLVLKQGEDSHLIRLGDVARVEKGTVEDRNMFRGNGVTQVGVGIVKQSTANTVDVARGAKAEKERINQNLPPGMRIEESFYVSVFVERAIQEVYITMALAIAMVVLMIYLFLGSARAMIVPAVAVPVSVVA